MRGIFVTGTDTGVGKTLVSAAIIRVLVRAGFKTVGMKPVASGSQMSAEGLRNDDALQLQAAANVARPYALVNPYAFVPPIAPHIAAREAGVTIELTRILAAFRELCAGAEAVVVEGVGGWQVPLGDDWGVPELARALGLPVVLVVGLRLGCLNHARLSARAIVTDGLKFAGWIANGVDPGFARRVENLDTLTHSLGTPSLGVVSWQPGASADATAEQLDIAAVLRLLHAFAERGD